MSERDKVTVDDIIGIVHTDEPTDSVEEVRKLRGRENKTEKRFTMNEDGYIWDNKKPISQETVLIRLNALHEENEQLKKDCTVLIYHNQEYRKENEQLKADKQSLIEFIKKEFPKSYKHILEGFE